MPSELVLVEGIIGGGSFDVNDTSGKRLGRVDLVNALSGRRLWNKYDSNNLKIQEGVCTPEDAALDDRSLVITIWFAK